jgi:hypothetical protein
LRTRAVIGISFFIVGACATHDEPLGCAELVVTCPEGAEQQWWLAKKPTSSQLLEIQGRQCGSWLAFIQDGATARYDDIDLGAREGEMRLRVVVAAADATGGTLSLFADGDMSTLVTSCTVSPTGDWFNWLVVDCGALSLRGLHSLTFKFTGTGTSQYVFNFAAFGVARSGSPDCTVTGPKMND